MSIPSLMTPTVAHNSHYTHHPAHSTSTYTESHLGPYSGRSLQKGPIRLPSPYSYHSNSSSTSRPQASRQLPPLQNMAQSLSSSTQRDSRKRDRHHPDWEEFYKNGPPKEIIVIDDDEDDEDEEHPHPPQPPPQQMHNTSSLTQLSVGKDDTAHTSKKRRTGQTSAYDSARDNYAPSHSHRRTYSHGNSGSNTNSTDRTASMGYNTTAPTSLSSTGSAGAAYIDDATVGQKRKRTTRKSLADERRLKDIDILGDPNSQYVPPPHPPIKAKDVHVPHVRDVSFVNDSQLLPRPLINYRTSHRVKRLMTTMATISFWKTLRSEKDVRSLSLDPFTLKC